MIKIIIVLLLSYLTFSTYNVTRARNLALICADAFATEAEINSWTCKYCPQYKLINTKAFNNSILDIFGFTGYSPDDNAIIVTFRSTVSVQNWIVDLDANQVSYPGCSGCQVHQGFYNAFMGVEGYIRSEIQKLQALYRDAKVYAAGFSLGSALTTIACLDIHNLFGHCDELYTYGEPRVGNENFANFVTQSIPQRYRVIHHNDIVPHLPPQLPIPYAHFAYEIWYDKNMQSYKQCGAEEFKCSKSVLPTSWSSSDHDINYYIKIGA